MSLKYEKITHEIIGAAFEVHRVLGYGFLEKVYQKALYVELKKRGVSSEMEPCLRVVYKGEDVGNYFGDLLVERVVMVELKAHKEYRKEDEAQLLNELKCVSEIDTGLLINLGRERVEFKRMVM